VLAASHSTPLVSRASLDTRLSSDVQLQELSQQPVASRQALLLQNRDSSSRQTLLQRVRANATPPFSVTKPRFREEEQHTQGLGMALRDSALVRTEAAHTVATISREFEHDFKPGNPSRAAATSLVVKSSKLVARLSDTCSNLEFQAAAALNISKIGTAERESIIDALKEGMAGSDMGVEWVYQQMLRALEEERDRHEGVLVQAQTELGILQAEVAVSEDAMKRLRQYAESQGVKFEDERRATVAHLYRMAAKRIVQRDLALAWSKWHDTFKANILLKKTAGTRLRNSALSKSVRTWKMCYPPRARLYREMQPYRDRIDDLEGKLRKERQAHMDTRSMLEARAEGSEQSSQRAREAEKQKRVEHLTRIAVRRIAHGELSRGWSKWAHAAAEKKRCLQLALRRLRNQSLYAAMRAWKLKHPPDPGLSVYARKAIAELEAKVNAEKKKADDARAVTAAERAAHNATREDNADRLSSVDQQVQEAHQASAHLRGFLSELQSVIREAYDAPSWPECKRLLYHERLRYVPTAATHSRGSSSPSKSKAQPESPNLLRQSSQKLSKRIVAEYQTGRLTPANLLRQAVRDARTTEPDASLREIASFWSSSLRSSVSGPPANSSGHPARPV